MVYIKGFSPSKALREAQELHPGKTIVVCDSRKVPGAFRVYVFRIED